MTESKLLGPILVQLGSNADAVAETLRGHCIRGMRNTVRYLNPIVRIAQLYLRLDDYGLSVEYGDGMARYVLKMTLPNGKDYETAFPEPVRDFLDAFNAGGFPDLELPQSGENSANGC